MMKGRVCIDPVPYTALAHKSSDLGIRAKGGTESFLHPLPLSVFVAQ